MLNDIELGLPDSGSHRPSEPTGVADATPSPSAPTPIPGLMPRGLRIPLVATSPDVGKLALLTIQRETGLSVPQLAARLGVKRQALQTYLYQNRNPSVRWLYRLMAAVGGRILLEFPKV